MENTGRIETWFMRRGLLMVAMVVGVATLTACSHATMMVHGSGATRPVASDFGLGPRDAATRHPMPGRRRHRHVQAQSLIQQGVMTNRMCITTVLSVLATIASVAASGRSAWTRTLSGPVIERRASARATR